ncbi:hypothetical protein SAY86_028354 [Trapa natans]|uniref:Transport and golgi organization 2-like protein n=1 Tax=Trapa natans TaxID=22666 RepID=A0AAN7MIB6_TRANT|nr:hypothetical protein SAY86_028354 [Trapa natans]
MCIAGFVWLSHHAYPLILLMNRDEYHNRPTRPVGWWEDGEVVGGRDEISGGTWLACSRGGRVAFLTIVLEKHTNPNAKSMGDLPVLFLKSTKSPKEFAEELVKLAHQYNGFNLIVGDLLSNTMMYISNCPKGEALVVEEVSPGIHVLINAKLDSMWHKAKRLGDNLKELFSRSDNAYLPIKEMKKLMRDTVKGGILPHIWPPNVEFGLSSIYNEVDRPLGRYGTRSTALLTVKTDGEVSFQEMYLEEDIWKEKSVKYYIKLPQSTCKERSML